MPKQPTNQEVITQVVSQVVTKVVNPLKAYIDERFNEVDKRFKKVDDRFDAVDKRFNEMDNRFNEVDKRFNEVDERFNEVLNATGEHFDTLRTMIDGTMTKAKRTEDDHVGVIDWLKRHDQRFDHQSRQLQSHTIAIKQLKAKQKRVKAHA